MSDMPPPPAPPPPANVSAIILAAGMGERLGEPKAFIAAAGRSLLERVISAVTPFASQVIAAVPADFIARAEALVGQSAKIVIGGSTRMGSVEILATEATRPYILLHEAARPFTTPDLFARVLAAAMETGAACPVVPTSRRDSLAVTDGEYFGEALSRDHVVNLQTPQAFRRAVLADALNMAQKNSLMANSVVPLCKQAGHPVRLVPGADDNLKITFPEDWDAALLRLGD